MPPELIGWLSSIILLATITTQIIRQYKARTSKGVSRWLFIGQLAASAGFTVYSIRLHNTVFIVTNVLMLASNIAGLLLLLHHRRHESNP
jgi:MtN3 and saliva related transmembrane protein